MKPTNPNAHTYVEDNDVKVSIMIGDENVNAQTYRKTVEQRHCSGSVFSWRAASSAFRDMEAMRDERITHEMSCVGNHTGVDATR